MYIPLAYWNTQGDAFPTMRLNVYTTISSPTTVKYTYEGASTTSSIPTTLDLVNICADIYNGNQLASTPNPGLIAAPAYFCSAFPSSSGITQSQCCVSSPPNTGPEAWYFDVSYPANAGDNGPYYYNYINEFGQIVNDTISFGQVKRIIAQAAPLLEIQLPDTYVKHINWVTVERYPGDVIPYPLKDVPTRYTIQLKRDDATTGGFSFPLISFSSLNFNANNGVYSIANKGNISVGQAASLNATKSIDAADAPIDFNVNQNQYGNSIWIISASVLPKAAHRLTACDTTNSIWVTMDNYQVYQTGSVLKVTNTQLTTTASCWTVTNLTSSLSTSVQLQNVNISQSYSEGECALCINPNAQTIVATGGTTGSFVSGSSIYKFHKFETNGTLSIVTGSTSDVKIMVIAGGGGGGNGGGGGAGGVVYSSSISINTGDVFNTTIGTGGAAYNGTAFNLDAANGTDTTFTTFNGTPYNIVAIGGGAGASFISPGVSTNGGNGGSGGGGNSAGGPGTGTPGQGNNGGSAGTRPGGGGGAALNGSSGVGGDGRQLGTLMFGSSSFYGGGGGTVFGGATLINGAGQNNYGGGGIGGGGSGAGTIGKNGVVVVTYKLYV